MSTQVSRFDARAQPQHQRVVQPLRAAAGIDLRIDHHLFGTRDVMARPHRRPEGFDVRPSFGGDPSGQSAHPIRALAAQRHRAPIHPIAVVEQPVRIQGVGDAPPDDRDEGGVPLTGMAHQRAFRPILVLGGGRREHVEGVTHLPDVILTDRAGLDRISQRRQLRRQRGAGQRAPRGDAGRDPEPAPYLGGRDAQPTGQHVAHLHPGRQCRIIDPVGRIGDLTEQPVGQSTVDSLLSLQPLGHLDPKRVAHQIR